MPSDATPADALALAGAIRSGAVTAPAAMEAALSAAASLARLGAIAGLDADLGRAAALDRSKGAFAGVPFLAKDLGAVARGLPAAAGSPALRRRVPASDEDSALFARFRAAGLAPFGVSATPEFGLSLCCEPRDAPPTRNPWDEAQSPGGSSGGAAAAVAAGIVAIAHATDAAGSIRVPAACCGLTGLKPSRGVTPMGPDFDNFLMGLVGELVLARSVRDVSAAFDAVAGPGAAEAPRRILLAIPPRCDADQADAARGAATTFVALRSEVVEIDPGPLDALGARAASVARLILSVSLADWLDALEVPDDEISPLAAAVAAEGRATPATALFAATTEMERIAHEFHALVGDAALLTPVLSGPPPRIGHFSGADPAAHFAAMEALAPNIALANVAGAPALALPFTTGPGLPVGLQITAGPGADRALLALGARLESTLPRPEFPHPIAGLPQ